MRPSPLPRQVTVTVAELFCVVGTLFGTGVIGTRVEESSGGALAADATRLAPAGPAFSIWSVIYLGLLAYTVWQWLPRNGRSELAQRTGWLAAASMVLNATWLLVTQQGWIWASVVVIFALMAVLVALLRQLHQAEPRPLVQRVVLDGTFGVYTGWVAVATCANVTAALVADGVRPPAFVADLAAVVVLAVAAGVGVLLARSFGGRWAVSLASIWGLSWILIGRITDEPYSPVTALAAAVAGGAIAAATWQARALAQKIHLARSRRVF